MEAGFVLYDAADSSYWAVSTYGHNNLDYRPIVVFLGADTLLTNYWAGPAALGLSIYDIPTHEAVWNYTYYREGLSSDLDRMDSDVLNDGALISLLLNAFSEKKMLLLSIDTDGNVVHSKSFWEPSLVDTTFYEPLVQEVDSEGNIYVGFWADLVMENRRAFIAKLDSSYELQWCKELKQKIFHARA